MVYRFFYSLSLVALACFHVEAGGPSKPPYPIKLNRSYQVGMKTHELITVSNLTSIKLGENPMRGTEETLKLECDIHILALKDGLWSTIEVTVTSVDATAKGLEPVFTALNLPITAMRKDGIVSFIRKDGKPLSVTDIQVLKTCFVPAGGVSPDDLMGTDALQSPGGSWPVNSENLAKQLKSVSGGSMQCKPENTNGWMKLFRAWDVKGETYLQVGGTTNYDPIALSGPRFQQLPESTAKASLTFSYQLPTDPSLPAAKMEETFSVTISGKQNTPDGAVPATVRTTAKKTRWITILEAGTQDE